MNYTTESSSEIFFQEQNGFILLGICFNVTLDRAAIISHPSGKNYHCQH